MRHGLGVEVKVGGDLTEEAGGVIEDKIEIRLVINLISGKVILESLMGLTNV